MSHIAPEPLPPSTLPANPIARQPVLTANTVGALVLEVCVLLRTFGVPLSDAQQNSITAVAGLIILIGAAIIARRFTTPLADPRDNQGRPLTPSTSPPRPDNPIGGQFRES
jgi:hypothetical protein